MAETAPMTVDEAIKGLSTMSIDKDKDNYVVQKFFIETEPADTFQECFLSTADTHGVSLRIMTFSLDTVTHKPSLPDNTSEEDTIIPKHVLRRAYENNDPIRFVAVGNGEDKSSGAASTMLRSCGITMFATLNNSIDNTMIAGGVTVENLSETATEWTPHQAETVDDNFDPDKSSEIPILVTFEYRTHEKDPDRVNVRNMKVKFHVRQLLDLMMRHLNYTNSPAMKRVYLEEDGDGDDVSSETTQVASTDEI